MEIGGKAVDPQHPYIIGEVGLAHDGSLNLAHSYIDAIADTGADAVKFQMHTPRNADWRTPPRWPQDDDRYAYWKRTAFTRDQWIGLKEHANASHLHFLISPFSLEAFHEIKCIGVPAWKVPSGRIKDHELLRKIGNLLKPVILSTGMATWEEIDASISAFRLEDLVVLQCSSSYPTPPHLVGMNVLGRLRPYGCLVGLSDHSGTIFPSIIALREGASVIEVHVILDSRMHGFDASSSVTPAKLAQIVHAAKFVPKMDFVDKNDLEPYEEARRVFM